MRQTQDLTAVILCGGQGLRIWPMTKAAPKPLMRLGGRELLYHVMDQLARQGIVSFILAAGHRDDLIRDFARRLAEPWQIEVIATPVAAETWERLASCQELVSDTFLVTYADGLANIDVGAALAVHEAKPGICTVTVASLISPYGLVDLAENGQVTGFTEKPRLDNHLINAGFILFDDSIFGTIQPLGLRSLEREVLPELAARHMLFAYLHNGFFRSVDTYKDLVDVEQLIADGHQPWLEPVSSGSSSARARECCTRSLRPLGGR